MYLGVRPLYHDVKLGSRRLHVSRRRNRRDNDQEAVFITRLDAFVLDRDGEGYSLYELAVSDLFLDERAAAKSRRFAAAPGSDETSAPRTRREMSRDLRRRLQ